jgi:glycine dehydrogenase subunit 2
MLVRAALEKRGNPRKYVLIPDSAHGTNPSSAHLSGYAVQEIKSNADGMIDVEDLAKRMTEDVAALMVTNPNTLGVFESDICRVAEIVHAKGGFLYMDGANMNALTGIVRPGDMGVDVIHINLHKTFATPHGGGGPGSGPVGVVKELIPFLPTPIVVKTAAGYALDGNRPASIGRVRGFYGNFLVVVKALTYILALGAEGVREIAEIAVLNANYIRKSLEGIYHLQYDASSLHEVVFDDKIQKDAYGVTNLDIAKRLIDYGFHPPTMSFPLIVHGALMIEPTETESKRDLDAFIETMKTIAEEARTDPAALKAAPHHSYVRRLDETAAARNPVVKWETPKSE